MNVDLLRERIKCCTLLCGVQYSVKTRSNDSLSVTADDVVGLGIRLAIVVAVVAVDLGSPPATVAAVVVGLGPWLAAVALHQQKSRWCQLPCS